MPDADRFSLLFYGDAQSPTTGRFTEHVYTELPASREVNLPELAVLALGYDEEFGTLQAQIDGSSAASMDLAEVSLRYSGQFGPVVWEIQFNPSHGSLPLPQLSGPYADILPFSSEHAMTPRYLDLDIVNGFDALMQATRQYRGSVDHLKMDAAEFATGVDYATDVLEFDIVGTGTVTMNLGEGDVEVVNGDSIAIPLGTSVTITATPSEESLVSDFETPDCILFGQPQPEVCTFVMEGQAEIEVIFEQLP